MIIVVIPGEETGAVGVDEFSHAVVEALVTAPSSSTIARGHSWPVTGSYTATPGNGSPMDSSGEFSVRVMMIASSVEP